MASVTDSFTATGTGTSLMPKNVESLRNAEFNFSLSGTFVGTVQLERSFDGGSTYLPLTALGSAISWTAPCSETFEEEEFGVLYRAHCTAYTSGTINSRLSR